MKNFLFFLLCLLPFNTQAYEYKLAITSIFQNESRFMKEWIDYHLVAGVEHFWLYNNNSTDNYLKVLDPYIKKGIVEIIEWPSSPTLDNLQTYVFDIQCSAFNDALNKARNRTEWLALIDLDEFIVPAKTLSIPKVLKKFFKNKVGVGIDWQCFGTSFVPFVASNELMIEKLILRMPQNDPYNKFYKSIVKPRYATSCLNPHGCMYKENKLAVDTNSNPLLPGQPKPIYRDKLFINHYWTRDEWHFNHIKIPRYAQWKIDSSYAIELNNRMNQIEDKTIHRFLGAIKKLNRSKN